MITFVVVVMIHLNLFALIYVLAGARPLAWFVLGDMHLLLALVITGIIVTIHRRAAAGRACEKLDALRALVNKPTR